MKVPARLKSLLLTVNQNLSVLLVKTGFQDREGTKISLKEHINCLITAMGQSVLIAYVQQPTMVTCCSGNVPK